MPNLPRLYSDNDVAGMVYGPSDNPDAILAEFMRQVLGEGWDVLGILQRRVDGAASKNRSVEFVLTPETEWTALASPDARAAILDGRASERLPELGRRLAAALVRKPDLIVLNRFGRAELENNGLIGVLSDALTEVVPIVVAVPEGLRDVWIASTGGLAVLVASDPDRLMGWWRSLGNGPPVPKDAPGFCPHSS
ncbi:MAG: DUF2478 domain-containing protein [Zymomonas sp.]|nr:MAG: DUF2478 domain-containing protein [Zymomonas sp.]